MSWLDDDYGRASRPTTPQLDKTTRILTKALKNLKNLEIKPERILDKEGLDWWKKVEAAEAKKDATKRKREETDRLKRSGYGKLTPAERTALNIRYKPKPVPA